MFNLQENGEEMMEDIEDEMMEDEKYDEEGDFQENSYLSEDDKSLRNK